jgi:hypothetical protein
MELVERYLQAVRCWLPKAQQDDIIAELSEDIRSQVADLEAGLGHPLDEDELAALLKERGHPVAVAGSYLPQGYLIGPALFPTYRVVLKILLLWIIVPAFVFIVGPIRAFTSPDPGRAVVATLGSLWQAAISAIGIITLVFAILEQQQVRLPFLHQWDPRRLPALRLGPEPKPGSLFGSIIELVFVVIFTTWWLEVVWSQTLYRSGGVEIVLGPVWATYRVPILIAGLAGIMSAGLKISSPSRTRLRSAIQLVRDGITLVVALLLFRGEPWVVVHAPNLPAAMAEGVTIMAELSAIIGILGSGVGAAIGLLVTIFRLIRVAPKPARMPDLA